MSSAGLIIVDLDGTRVDLVVSDVPGFAVAVLSD